tara:strand:- start:680 stop:1846 length:1167 start_codon:yes stop_codon:yes gene_type:complete
MNRGKDINDLCDVKDNFVLKNYRNITKQYQRVHQNNWFYSDGGGDFPSLAHNGTGSSYAAYASGNVPSALSFGAGTSAAGNKENTDGTAVDGGVFSCAVWARNDNPGGYSCLASKYHNHGGTSKEWLFYLHSDRLAFNLMDEVNGGHQGVRATSQHFAGTKGNWAHYAVTYDGRGGSSARNGIKLYVNGSEITSVTNNSNFESATGSYARTTDTMAPLYIGVAPYNPNGSAVAALIGYISDLAIWNRTLSESEINRLYRSNHASVSIFRPWGHWRMGDGTNPAAIGDDAAGTLKDSIDGTGNDVNSNRIFDQSGNGFHMYAKQGTIDPANRIHDIKSTMSDTFWRKVNFSENGTGGAIEDHKAADPIFRGAIPGPPSLRFGGAYKVTK